MELGPLRLPKPPYEQRLAEAPGSIRQEFDDWVELLILRSRPGWMYRSLTRRRQARASWERAVRAHMGRAYELGLRSQQDGRAEQCTWAEQFRADHPWAWRLAKGRRCLRILLWRAGRRR